MLGRDFSEVSVLKQHCDTTWRSRGVACHSDFPLLVNPKWWWCPMVNVTIICVIPEEEEVDFSLVDLHFPLYCCEIDARRFASLKRRRKKLV